MEYIRKTFTFEGRRYTVRGKTEKDTIIMDTGAKIKQLRESLDMTQEDLGKLLGVKKAAINKYETGTVVNLKRSTIENLCNIFNVTPQYLLSDSDLSQPSSSASELELTEQEERLLGICRSLNEEGRDRLVEYGDDLVASGKYIKSCEDDVVG